MNKIRSFFKRGNKSVITSVMASMLVFTNNIAFAGGEGTGKITQAIGNFYNMFFMLIMAGGGILFVLGAKDFAEALGNNQGRDIPNAAYKMIGGAVIIASKFVLQELLAGTGLTIPGL